MPRQGTRPDESVVISILLVVTVFLNNSNAQLIVMLTELLIMVTILLLGSISMESANQEYIRAEQIALQRHMAEQFSRLYLPRS